MTSGNIFTACTTTVMTSPKICERMRNVSVGVQYSSPTNYSFKYQPIFLRFYDVLSAYMSVN